MSLFIRLDAGFWTHRKTMRLRAAIGDAALWVPPRLWAYAAVSQPDGDFSDYSAEEIAMLVGYADDAQALLEALQKVGFMDGMKIHDWQEHNGYHSVYAERAKKAAKARWRGKDKTGEDKTREERRGASIAQASTSNAPSNASSIPTEKKPNKAKGTREEVASFFRELRLPPFDAEWFFEKCEGCGWKNGGKPILDWKATVRSWNAAGYMPSQKQSGNGFGKPARTGPVGTRSNPLL